MIFEYVASGCTYLRFASEKYNHLHPVINDIITDFQGKSDRHYFSALFNAFVEKSLGKNLNIHLHESLKNIHADSGGLQMVTRGIEATEKDRLEIYDIQSKYSTVAMCFDNIPVQSDVRGTNACSDVANKTLQYDRLPESGKLTGLNVKRQIERFIENESNTGVYLIAQGNTYDDFMTFFDSMVAQIPDDYMPYVKGIAVADTCLGNGVLESADMVSYIPRFNIEDRVKNNIHLLGVGSIRRLLPTLLMMQSGFLNKDTHISYDSTTHTRQYHSGVFMTGDGMIKMGRNYSQQFEQVFKGIWTKYNKYITENDYDKYLKLSQKCVNSPSWAYKAEKEIDEFGFMNIIFFMMYQIEHFTDVMDKILDDKKYIAKFISGRSSLVPLLYLSDIKTVDEYESWRNSFGSTLDSKRIKRRKSTEEEFNLGMLL